MIRSLLSRKQKKPDPVRFLPATDHRLYVIGDIHGRFDLLRSMMSRLAADHEKAPRDGRKPKLVFLGDYIDRGDRSRDVLEAMMRFGNEPIFLKGNHEAALLAFLEDPERNKSWLRFGGLQTLASYQIRFPSMDGPRHELRDAAIQLRRKMGPHVDFIRNMPLSYRSGDVVCVHAGLDPEDPTTTDEEAILWGRSSFVETGGVSGMLVVHGHYDAPDPVVTSRRICLDTGAYYSGRLTAARIDEGVKIITVDVLDD